MGEVRLPSRASRKDFVMQSEPKLVRRAFECPRPLLPRGILTEPLKEAKKISPIGVVFFLKWSVSHLVRPLSCHRGTCCLEGRGPREGPRIPRGDGIERSGSGESEVQSAGFQNLWVSV